MESRKIWEVRTDRCAHLEGFTDLAFVETGNEIITCGADGKVKVFKNLDDDDPKIIQLGEINYSVACKGDRFAVTDDVLRVNLCTLPDASLDGVATTFTSPATCLDFNITGRLLAIGGSDFIVKVVDLNDHSYKAFRGHGAPVLSVAYDPKEIYVVSSSCDGTVRMWDISLKECVHTWEDVTVKSNEYSFNRSLCRISWQPEIGKHLAVPVGQQIQILHRDNWSQLFTLRNPNIKEDISICSFSPCTKYVAASSIDGIISVWNVENKVLIKQYRHLSKRIITSLKWHPSKERHSIGFADNMGYIGIIHEAVKLDDLLHKDNTVSQQSKAEEIFNDEEDEDEMMRLIDAAALCDENESDKENVAAAADDDDDERNVDSDGNIDLDNRSDDGGLNIEEALSQLNASDDDDNDGGNDDVGRPVRPLVESEDVLVPAPSHFDISTYFKPQPSFQPTSTPPHLLHRFMCWNHIGIVWSRDVDGDGSIDVQFHDASTHHSLHIVNNMDYTMASLSERGLVLASDGGDHGPSHLYCMHFASWDSNKDWTISMPESESIKAVTASSDWLAVATDHLNLRLFSLGGLQYGIFSISGPVVTLAARHDALLITHHNGLGIPGNQNIGMVMYNVRPKRSERSLNTSLPLSPKSLLMWSGFTDKGTPCTVDTRGVVRLYMKNMSNMWIPVQNLKSLVKGKSDNYWVVDVNESMQQIRSIYCRGSRYPPTLPHPSITILPLQLPMCDPSSDKSQLEESYWKQHLFSGKGSDETNVAATLMKLFAFSVKSDHDYRAVEVAQLMPSSQSVQLAIKYASRVRRMVLAAHLTDVARAKAREEEADVVEEEDDVVEEEEDEMVKEEVDDVVVKEEEVEEEEDFRVELDAIKNTSATEWSPMKKPKFNESVRGQSSSTPQVPDTPTYMNPFKMATPQPNKFTTVNVTHEGELKGIQALDSFKPPSPAKRTTNNVKKGKGAPVRRKRKGDDVTEGATSKRRGPKVGDGKKTKSAHKPTGDDKLDVDATTSGKVTLSKQTSNVLANFLYKK